MIARRFRRLAVPVAIGVIGLGLTGCSSNTTTDAATVTYTDHSGSHTIHITRSEFKTELGQLVGSTQFQAFLKSNNFPVKGDQKNTTGANISATYLGQVVEQTAIDAEFSALNLSVTPTVHDNAVKQTKVAFLLPNEIGQDAQGNQTALVETGAVYTSLPTSLQNVLIDRTARSDAVAEYYTNATAAKQEALYSEFAATICPSGRMVSQILVKDASTANAILDQLKSGASFATLAKTKSTDTTSAKVGGSVGCLRKGAFVKEFEDASYAAPFGVPVGPVKSQFGYHVILVTHPSFADVRSQLAQALAQNPIVLVQELRLQAMHVWINPQFGKGGLAVDSQQGQLHYQVTPPTVPAPRSVREKSAPTTTSTSTVPAGG